MKMVAYKIPPCVRYVYEVAGFTPDRKMAIRFGLDRLVAGKQ